MSVINDQPKFEVGMSFFYRPNGRKDDAGSIVKITKIGSRWITLSNTLRIDRTSDQWRHVDGGIYSSPGVLWYNEQEYLECMMVKRIIRAIERKFQFTYSPSSVLNVSLDNAKQAAKLLGVEVE